MKMLKNNTKIAVLVPALIGLVLASLVAIPLANASGVTKIKSSGGAGYQAIISSGEITQATAQWNQPAITCQPSLSEQSEISGLVIENSTTGLFISTIAACNQGSNNPVYAAFFIYGVNGAASPIFQTSPNLAVHGGDQFSATISIQPSTQILNASITDLSTGKLASETFAQGSFPANPRLVSWGLGITSPALAQFSIPIRFSNCTVTVSGNAFTISKSGTVTAVTMVDSAGNTMVSTSSLSKAGSSFKLTWVSST
jgi:hypothetical protein